MDEFDALVVNESEIVLKNSKDLENLYNIIKAEKVFIISWVENKEIYSKIFKGSALVSKVESNELTLSSKEEYKEI